MIVLVNMSFTSYFPSSVRHGTSHTGSTEMLGSNQLTFRNECVRARVDAHGKLQLDGLHSLVINHKSSHS